MLRNELEFFPTVLDYRANHCFSKIFPIIPLIRTIRKHDPTIYLEPAGFISSLGRFSVLRKDDSLTRLIPSGGKVPGLNIVKLLVKGLHLSSKNRKGKY